MKNRLIYAFFAVLIFLSSCARSEAGDFKIQTETLDSTVETETTETLQTLEEIKTTEKTPEITTTVPPETTTLPVNTESSDTTKEQHTHKWNVSSVTDASCAANGSRIFSCSCGESSGSGLCKTL